MNMNRRQSRKELMKSITDILKREEASADTNFFAEQDLNPSDIIIEVDGVGQLSFPLNRSCVDKLISVSSKARFGLKEETVMDVNVRNTQEIAADKLNVNIDQNYFITMMKKMRKALGLAPNSILTSHLHNMLIYGPGQFFDYHQDSEKLERMIATLVIVLPCAHIGGDLKISHGKTGHTFSSETIEPMNAKCIGFYADCPHMVEKVKQGYRVALTYNLVLESEDIDTEINEQLVNALQVYFNIPEEESYKFCYFLNHTYTEHGLRWDMLKGEDRINGLSIYLAAKQLGLRSHLALSEIQQTHYAEEINCPGYIVNVHVSLTDWVDSSNKKLAYDSCKLKEEEICMTKENDSFEAFDSEYEGFTGNEGNTMDYWYRRAAVVLWPEADQIPLNFQWNYANALDELCALKDNLGNEEKAMEIIKNAGVCLRPKYGDNESTPFFKKMAEIAIYIKNKDVAASILSGFKWAALDTSMADPLVKLQKQYSAEWCTAGLNYMKGDNNSCILENISSLVDVFIGCGVEMQIVELVLQVQCEAIIKVKDHYEWMASYSSLIRSEPERKNRLFEMLVACTKIQNSVILNKVIDFVISAPNLYPEISLAEVLLKLQHTDCKYLEYCAILKNYVMNKILQEIASGPPKSDDMSLNVSLYCNCKYCKILKKFLLAKNEKSKVWPFDNGFRVHVMISVADLDLPVKISVEGKRSPYKLVLEKTDALHEKALERFHKLKSCQESLHM